MVEVSDESKMTSGCEHEQCKGVEDIRSRIEECCLGRKGCCAKIDRSTSHSTESVKQAIKCRGLCLRQRSRIEVSVPQMVNIFFKYTLYWEEKEKFIVRLHLNSKVPEGMLT